MIHIDPKTGITTTTQNMQQGFYKNMSTTARQYTQPIFETTDRQYTHPTFKTTAAQYTLPASLNHSSTCTKSQHLPLNTTGVPHQPTSHHTLKHTYTSVPSDKHHSSKHSSSLPSPLPTPETIPHLPSYHIPSQRSHKSHTNMTYQTSSFLAPKSSHTHTQIATIIWRKPHSPTPHSHQNTLSTP